MRVSRKIVPDLAANPYVARVLVRNWCVARIKGGLVVVLMEGAHHQTRVFLLPKLSSSPHGPRLSFGTTYIYIKMSRNVCKNFVKAPSEIGEKSILGAAEQNIPGLSPAQRDAMNQAQERVIVGESNVRFAERDGEVSERTEPNAA